MAVLNGDNLAFVKFVLVGGVNTAFAYSVYAALLLLGAEPWLANFGALVLGILFSFFSVGKFVFGHMSVPSFLRFVASWGVIYGLQTSVIYLLIAMGLDAMLAGLAVLPATALLSFIIQRFIVFR